METSTLYVICFQITCTQYNPPNRDTAQLVSTHMYLHVYTGIAGYYILSNTNNSNFDAHMMQHGLNLSCVDNCR